MQRYEDYIAGLEEERRKIQVFQRELPLCLDLVTQAIETCKQQQYLCDQCCSQSHDDDDDDDDDDDEHMTSSPVLEELLIPCLDHDDQIKRGGIIEKDSKKSDWLRSVQLWNQTPAADPTNFKEDSPREVVGQVRRNSGGGGGTPTSTAPPTLEEAVINNPVPPASTTSSTEDMTDGTGKHKKELLGGDHRKTRRCWSPDLHAKFVQALKQLGGSHAATPKQIRDFMKVDGLTNDEVKSHLQKYRLHTRRPSPSTQNIYNNSQTPQIVVVGGIWVPPEYAAAMAARGGDATATGIYTPVATIPQHFQETSKSPEKGH